jgi:DNA-binding GntR family transcriptional regulator
MKQRTKVSPTISSDLYGILRRDIIDGCFRSGEKLRIESLREIYSVGNSPLREALTKLAANGLIIQESQRGFYVPPTSRDDLQDICDTRIHIEVAALKLSIAHADDAWEGRVLAVYHKLKKAQLVSSNDTEQWEVLHNEFHLTLIDTCNSPTLKRFNSVLHDQFDRYRRLAPSDKNIRAQLDAQHLQIIELALAGDVEKAGQVLTAHIRLSAKSALALFTENHT